MLSRALAGAARQVSVSAARAERQLLRDKQMRRLTSTTAAPAAEASKPAADGVKPAQDAANTGGGQSNSGGGKGQAVRLGLGEASMGIGVLVGVVGGVYAVFEARQQRETTKEALAEMKSATAKVEAEMKSATAEVKVVAAMEQQKAEKNLDKLVSDAKEAIRLHKEALQVQQTYGMWAPFVSSAVGFVLSLVAATALISRSSK